MPMLGDRHDPHVQQQAQDIFAQGLEALNMSPILMDSPEPFNPLLFLASGGNPGVGLANNPGSPLMDLNTAPPTYDNNFPPGNARASHFGEQSNQMHRKNYRPKKEA